MPTLDLTRLGDLDIKCIIDKPFPFKLEMTANVESLIGATVTMRIAKHYTGTAIQELSVGNGVTIVDASTLAFTPVPMQTNDSILQIEIEATTGDVYRIGGRISAING